MRVFQRENCEEYQAFPRNRFTKDPRKVTCLVGPFTAKLFTRDLHSMTMEWVIRDKTSGGSHLFVREQVWNNFGHILIERPLWIPYSPYERRGNLGRLVAEFYPPAVVYSIAHQLYSDWPVCGLIGPSYNPAYTCMLKVSKHRLYNRGPQSSNLNDHNNILIE